MGTQWVFQLSNVAPDVRLSSAEAEYIDPRYSWGNFIFRFVDHSGRVTEPPVVGLELSRAAPNRILILGHQYLNSGSRTFEYRIREPVPNE